KELSDAKANLAGAQRRAEALVAEVDRLRSERAGAGDRGDQAAVARLTQLLETKEAEIARITGRADASDAKLHQYGQQIASLQGELRGRLSPEQVQHLNEQIRQLTAERGALEQRLTAQTPHIEHLETQLATATRAKDQINAKAKRIIDGLKEKLVEAEQVQGRENRNLKRQINQVKAAAAQEASAKDHEIAGLKGALTEAQKAAPSPAITQLLQQLRDQIGTMQREMSAMQRRGEGLPEAEKAAFTEREQELVVRIGALEQQVVNAENIARSEQAHKRELASIKEQLSTLLNKRVDTDNIEVLMRMIRDIPRSVDNSAQLERLEVAVGQLRNTDTRALQNEIITLREQLAASNKASREAEGRLLRNLQEAGTANNARLGELTAEVARLTEMLETSTRNDGVRAAQVATLENKLRGARAEIERLSVEIKEEPDPGLQSELDQANRRLRSLEEQRDHMQDIAVSAQLRNNALETANAALQDELKTQNDELQGIHDTLQSARDELLAAFKKADNDIDYMRDEIRDADRAAAWALNEADTLRDELTQKEEEITNLQKQLTENKRGNIAMQVDLNQRIDNLIQEKNRLKNLYRVIDEAQTSIIDALKSVIEGKNENLEQHRNRLIDAQVALSVALENQTQVDTSIDSLTDMVIELQGRLDHVLGEKASLEESFQTELFHKQSLQDRIATLTEDRNQLLEANHTINAEKEAMIDDLTAELHAVSQTLLQLQDEIQKCAAAESEIKQQHRLVMNAAREYNEDIVKRHAEEISTLQKQLSDQRIAKKEKTKLTRALAEEQEKYRKAETELNKMRSGNEQLAKALIKSHADFYSLHAKRREEIAKLSSQLETQGIETKQQAEWLRDFTRQMNEMFMENLSEREMINGLPDVIRKMLLHISTLESDISYLSTAERSIENLEDVNDETRAELTRVKSQLENAEVQLWTAKRTIGDLEDQAKTAKIDTRLAEQGKELAEAELAFVKARLTNAKGRISENTNRHIDEIIEKNAALRTVESELQGVLEEVQGIRPVAEELQQRIVDLQRDRDDLAAQVNELKGQLEETF
ncbi:MAG: hypothetical protein P0S94_02490, partial [Simkaniaceae bacterium]|nr:hypothetical protein [Simkaniaceae bacterium]